MDNQEYLVLSGSYHIEKFLFGLEHLNAGCGVQGQTVSGNISIDGNVVKCLTRPVFAYLVHTGSVKAGEGDGILFKQSVERGLSAHFNASIAGEFAVDPGIERVNGLSNITSGLTPEVAWGASARVKRPLLLSGRGAHLTYQMHMAYAHCLTGDLKPLVQNFAKYEEFQVNYESYVVFLSSIAFAPAFTVFEGAGVAPLEWDAIQALGLKGVTQGDWQIDLAADKRVSHRY